MTTLLYIHGFNSSPGSAKARQTLAWLAEHHPDINFVCPFLSPYPNTAVAELERIAENLSPPVLLLGSSMGGFYATWLADKYRWPAVLINPAVTPWLGRDYLLGDQENYHTGEIHRIEQSHLDQLRAYEVETLRDPQRLMVLLQTGDEVLDYRLAANKYRDCQILIEDGGDHSFIGFERHLPAIIEFFRR